MHGHLPSVRLVNLSAKFLLSCLGLLECSVLTWPPAGEVPVTCLLWGILLAREVVRTPLATETVLVSTAGMFLRIRSDFEAKWHLGGPREDQL